MRIIFSKRMNFPSWTLIVFFHYHLQLDPLLWTSYQALCDMGAVSSDIDDPIKVFGIVPSKCMPHPPSTQKDDFMAMMDSDIPTIQEEGVEDEDSHAQRNNSTVMTPADVFSRNQVKWHMTTDTYPRGQYGLKDDSLNTKTAPFATPVTPSTVSFDPDALKQVFGVKKEDHESGKDRTTGGRTSLPSATLFHTSSRSASNDARGVRRSSGMGSKPANTSIGYPTSSVMLNTPGLTPIPKSENRMSLDPAQQQQQQGLQYHPLTAANSTMDSFTIGNTSHIATLDFDILSKAKAIAQRMYYLPSPETTPPHAITAAPPSSMKLLRGKRSQLRCHDLEKDRIIDDPGLSKSDKGITVQTQNKSANKSLAKKTSAIGERVINRYSLEAPTGVSPLPSKEIPFKNNPLSELQANALKHPGDDVDENDTGIQQILELLCVLGTAQRYLSLYQCQETLQTFMTLPESQYNTGWVLHQVGRAYFELADYHNAQKALESMEKSEPHR